MTGPDRDRPLSVLLAGGGTAGHVAPLLALADCLRRRDPRVSITVLGTAEGLESRLVPQHGLRLELLPRVPLPRRPGPELIRLPGRLSGAVATASRHVAEADVVVGFGGYVATPAYLAARRPGSSRRPVVVHEQNAVPGLANRLGARLTRHVAIALPGTPLRGAVHTGMPLRREISGLDAESRTARRGPARARWGLDPDRTTLLVVGGSLGAARVNAVLAGFAPELAGAGVQVLHAAGPGKSVEIGSPPAGGPDAPDAPAYRVVEYLDDMADAYAAADVVLCRAGAGTVCEISALGLPAVFVPLPIGNGEQRLNAAPVVAGGGGLLVADGDLSADWLRAHLLPLLADPAARERMGRAGAAFGILDGDERLASMVLAAAGRPAAAAGVAS